MNEQVLATVSRAAMIGQLSRESLDLPASNHQGARRARDTPCPGCVRLDIPFIIPSPLSRVGIRQHATLRGPQVAYVANRNIQLNQNDFDSLEIGGKFLRALKDVGYTRPTPIQFMEHPAPAGRKGPSGCSPDGNGEDGGICPAAVAASGRRSVVPPDRGDRER